MRQSQSTIKRWRENPVAFASECLKVEPDPWQIDILQAFPGNERIALKACKNPGKTAVMAWCAWNFLSTRPHPKVIATSISGDNLADGLWAEMAKWQMRSPFLLESFEWHKESIVSKENPATWFMAARQWSKSADSSQQADTLAGKHADYMLFLLDEVGGIPDGVMAAADAALGSGIESKIMMAGNPTHREGPLYRACTVERKIWYVVEITGDPDNPKRAPRVKIDWARSQIERYGRDSAWVKANVLGQFPDASINSLLGPDEVSEAMGRHYDIDAYEFSQKRIGVDVARFGDDRTILQPRQGLVAFPFIEMRNARAPEIGARLMVAKEKFGSELEFVDTTGGFGAGVADYMLNAGVPVHEINFAGKAIDPRYANKRAEMWFLMSEWVKRGGALPKDPELVAELSGATYTFDNKGRLLLEPKELMKEKMGFSPDKADALCLTFALPEMAGEIVIPGMRPDPRGKMKHEWNPFDAPPLE